MFDTELEAALGDSRALTDLAANVENDSRIAGCRKLLMAAAWADAHSSVDHPDGGLLVERSGSSPRTTNAASDLLAGSSRPPRPSGAAAPN
ncbi:MAG TPA: hypothetical protein VIT65_12190 [Microlunatus sp.]